MNTAGNIGFPVYGVAAEFASAADLLAAAEKIRGAGYTKFDVFSPFPVRGMDRAMGLGHSIVGKVVFVGGVAGFLAAAAMVFVPSVFLYPLVVGGKPVGGWSAPAYLPIVFEATVLVSAFAAVAAMLALNGLPRFNHPVFNWGAFAGASDDKFFAAIEAVDPKFRDPDAAIFLASIGGTNVTRIHGEPR